MPRTEYEGSIEMHLPTNVEILERNATKLGMTDAAAVLAEEFAAMQNVTPQEILAQPHQDNDPQDHIRYAARAWGFWEATGSIGTMRLTSPHLDHSEKASEEKVRDIQALVTGIRTTDTKRTNGTIFAKEGMQLPSTLIDRNVVAQGNDILIVNPATKNAHVSNPDHSIPQFPGKRSIR